MAEDRVAAELAAIRRRNDEWIRSMTLTEASVDAAPFGDLRRALAAIEAVLALADDWAATAASLDRAADATGTETTRSVMLSARAQAKEDDARALREAITRALLSEKTDSPPPGAR